MVEIVEMVEMVEMVEVVGIVGSFAGSFCSLVRAKIGHKSITMVVDSQQSDSPLVSSFQVLYEPSNNACCFARLSDFLSLCFLVAFLCIEFILSLKLP